MSQNVYSICFMSVQGLSGAYVYTVPMGFRAIVDTVDVYMGAHTPAGTVRFQDYDVGNTIWFDQPATDADGYMSWRGRQVFDEGVSFQMSQADMICDVRVSGWLLTLP